MAGGGGWARDIRGAECCLLGGGVPRLAATHQGISRHRFGLDIGTVYYWTLKPFIKIAFLDFHRDALLNILLRDAFSIGSRVYRGALTAVFWGVGYLVSQQRTKVPPHWVGNSVGNSDVVGNSDIW